MTLRAGTRGPLTVALALGAVTALAGCGGGGGTPAEGAPADGAAPVEEPAIDASADLVIWADNERAPVITEYARQFEADYGVTVQVQVATDVRQQFLDATNVDQGPDIVVGAHDWLGELVLNGAVAPLQVDPEQQALFTENSIQATTFEGQTYGLPYATESVGLIRNTALAPEAPATMEDLLATGADLVSAGDADHVMLQQVGQEGDAYNAFPWLSAYGGGIFTLTDEGYSDELIVDSPETILGGDKLGLLGADEALSVNVGADNYISLFTQGRAPYLVAGPWAVPNVEGAGIDYEVTPIPPFEDGGDPVPFLGVQMFYVSAKADNRALAEEFVLDYVPRADFQEALYEAGGRTPALTEALDAVSAEDEGVAAWAEAGADAVPMPNIPAMNAVWGPLGQATADIVSGADPTERLTAAQDEIAGILGE